MTDRRLDQFKGLGYQKGRGRLAQLLWFCVSYTIFQAWWCPARLRPIILRSFGASIGRGSNIRNGVRVHWPWKLTVGEHVWIGEGAWLLNLEPITLGDHVCISQDAVLCTGGHARYSTSFEYDNGPISVGEGAWIAIRTVILRGVHVPAGALAPAGAVISRGSDCLDVVPTPRNGQAGLGPLMHALPDHAGGDR